MDRIGVVDTMFARYDMGGEAVDELEAVPGLRRNASRWSAAPCPGFKDLGRRRASGSSSSEGCRIVVALGMPGKAAIDQVCAHEASQGIMLAQLLTSTHILEVFVHENEEEDPARAGRGVRRPGPQARPQRLLDAVRARAAGPAAGRGRAPGLRGRRAARRLTVRRPGVQAGGSWGRPRVRSAMMLRCTSDGAAPMVSAGAKRNP